MTQENHLFAATLQNVTKIHGHGAAAVTAVNDVSIDIPSQRITVLSGPSGSGKSTLLNLLGGIEAATKGTITVAGQRIDTLRESAAADFRSRHVGFIFQSFNLLPVLTALENVEYPLVVLGVERRQRRAKAMALLHAVDMEDLASRKPGELSGGQQQRVAIARALVTDPALLLADEPTANLDRATGAAIIDLLRGLQRGRGMSCIVSSHDHQVLAAADAILQIDDGAVTQRPMSVHGAGVRP